jgi:LysM repeat protein
MHNFLICLLIICVSSTGIAQSTSHKVEKGETLYSISKKYHVTIQDIQKANKSLGENFKLKIGQKLAIPSSAAKSMEEKPGKRSANAPKSAKSESDVKATVKSEVKKAPVSVASDPSVHIVIKGETVYSLAKANGLTVKQLKDANQLSDDMKLKLGQKLTIPTKNEEAMYKPVAKEPVPEPVAKPKQPAVTIATDQGKDYLATQPAVIKKELVKPQETIEQIKPVETKPTPVPVKVEKTPEPTHDENPFEVPRAGSAKNGSSEAVRNSNINATDYAAVFNKEEASGKKKIIYRGIGIFMQSENPGNQFLALYNYAEMGAILKVTNLMSKESIYVKVIGKVPSGDTQKDVILKLSSDAAAKLKVAEDKFLVEVTGFNLQ